MTDTVERIARAICGALGLDPDDVVVEFPPGIRSGQPVSVKAIQRPRWHDYRADAQREIISAAARRELLAIEMERREVGG